MDKAQKILLFRVILSLALFLSGLLSPHPLGEIQLFVAYFVAGYTTLWTALTNLRHGQLFDENFLMTIATIGAICLRQWEEAVGVMVFYLIGSFFEQYAVSKSRRAISSLFDLRPDYATRLVDGNEVQVPPEEITVGDILVVRPGERIPLDSVVVLGSSSLDTSALTGEALPQEVSPGTQVISGCISLNGLIHVQATSTYEDSTVAKILDLVENSSNNKASTERFITIFAKYYTPIIVLLATLLGLVPPLFFGQAFETWIYRALLFLVISCPCALVISVPLSFFGGIGAASKLGILVKGGNYLQSLAKVDCLVFDKTGTLTSGDFTVTDVYGPTDLLELAALAQQHSSHPIARSICKAYHGYLSPRRVLSMEEFPGKGTKILLEANQVYVGSLGFMMDLSIDIPHFQNPCDDIATHSQEAICDEIKNTTYVAVDGKYYGHILLSDEIKPEASNAISRLRALGIKSLIMLTGDKDAVAQQVGKTVGLDKVYSQLLPEEKVQCLKSFITKDCPQVGFVGDGMNDAPALALSSVGIAMGGLGSQAAIEAADIVIMDDDISKIPIARQIATKTSRIATENIVFALSIKFLVLIFGALGFASMWSAVFADVGVSVLAIGNATRALFQK